MTLNSSDPFDFPIIDPGFFTHPLDVAIMVEALRTSTRMLATSPWQGIVKAPFGALGNATTDGELAAYARSHVTTFWHVSCTAKMGTLEDEMAVVDPSLRVKGVKGVRVVDASVFVSWHRLSVLHDSRCSRLFEAIHSREPSSRPGLCHCGACCTYH